MRIPYVITHLNLQIIEVMHLTLICFKRPEKVDKDWARDCSSPISAKMESNQGILTGSDART